MGYIVTFYSYKGGVGRTMALANIAILLSQMDLRVLAIDWDLEAPGLEKYFDEHLPNNRVNIGLLELLIQARNNPEINTNINWRDYLTKSDFGGKHELSFIFSGKRDSEYPGKVLSFDWSSFFKDCEGGDFIEYLREEWRKEFDVVLIDSRTGITDAGGICTIQLPDILVPVFTANYQSLHGIKDVALRAQKARQDLAFDRMPLLIFPLPSRFDSRAQYRESQAWLKLFSTELGIFYNDWLPKPLTPYQVLERTKLPYIAYFSFGEKLPVLSDGTSDPEGLGYAYLTAAILISSEFEDIERITGNLPLSSTGEIGERTFGERHDICPYKGLSYFDCNDIDYQFFHGREEIIGAILRRIMESSFLVITGASGSGKSSILRAGVLQKLKDNGNYAIRIIVPGEYPLRNLAWAFVQDTTDRLSQAEQVGRIESLIAAGSEGLNTLLDAEEQQKVVLAVDQLEEVFTLCQSKEERRAFFETLMGTLKTRASRLILIFVLRSDFVGKFFEENYSGLSEQVKNHLEPVLPMATEELTRV